MKIAPAALLIAVTPGKGLVRFFQMRLTRIGNSDWPGAGAVAPK